MLGYKSLSRHYSEDASVVREAILQQQLDESEEDVVRKTQTGLSDGGAAEEPGLPDSLPSVVGEVSNGSPPWRRLGPPSNNGDTSESGRALLTNCATRAKVTVRKALFQAQDWFGATAAAAQTWFSSEPPASRYVALIPLSDARLKPRRTRLIVSGLVGSTRARWKKNY